MDEIVELRDALDRLHAALEDLALRGLRSATPQDLSKLTALENEFRSAGAAHIAERLQAVLEAVRADERGAAGALLRVMTAIRLFDRLLTLDVAAAQLSLSADSNHSDSAELDEAH